LTHVINDLSAAGTIDLSGTSAIGSLTRLRAQCRGAKERLSTAAVSSLVAELPGHRSDVRLTRNELDEAIRAPLADFVGVVQETVERNGIRAGSRRRGPVGGGARIPIVTTTLSEHFRVPVITTGQPELTAAIGGGLRAARGTVDEGQTSMAADPGVAAAAAAATAMAPGVDPQYAPVSSTFRALAWSDADDVPDVAPTDPYEYGDVANGGVTDARPQMQFDHEQYEHDETAPLPWYRKPAIILGAGVVALLAALVAAVLFVMRDHSTQAPTSTTAPVTTTTPTSTTTAAAPPPVAPAPQTQAPQTRTVTQEAPPPPVTVTEAPPPPPPTSEAPPPPPPTTEAPPPTTEEPPAPPPFTLPPITLFPGGPTIPIGPQPPQPPP
jgi:hypothetical protein